MGAVATAFSPCSITGFFRIHDQFRDPLRVGSTGASVTLSKGVTTRVVANKSTKSKLTATFNNRALPTTSVSHQVGKEFLRRTQRPVDLRIFHSCELPVGCGYGTSGAGALSLSLALNESLDFSLTRVEAAQMAHTSEIACKTGLGTVASAFEGGLAIRKAPGAPGKGQVQKVLPPLSLRVVTASFGPISTNKMLQKSLFRNRVNECADQLVSSMQRQKSSASFVSLSRRFAECIDLMSQRLSRLIAYLDSVEIAASMAMLGESVFSVVQKESVPQVMEAIKRQGLRPIVCEIPRHGARLT